MEYDFREIEKNWQQRWRENKVYSVSEDPNKEKYYVYKDTELVSILKD